MKALAIFISLSILTNLQAAEKARGCLIRVDKKIRVDVKCECIQKKNCLKPKKFEYSTKFFDSKDVKNKPVFSEKEKKLFKETYDLTNKLNDLKAVGKGDTKEAKSLYFKLDKVNTDLSIELYKNKNNNIKEITKKYAAISKKKKEKDQKRLKEIKAYLATNKVEPILASPVKSGQSQVVVGKEKIKIEQAQPVNSKQESTNVAPPPIAKDSSGLSNEDKANILNSIKSKDLEVHENDSLFDIVSKAYKGKAYKKLLEPTPADEANKKAP